MGLQAMTHYVSDNTAWAGPHASPDNDASSWLVPTLPAASVQIDQVDAIGNSAVADTVQGKHSTHTAVKSSREREKSMDIADKSSQCMQKQWGKLEAFLRQQVYPASQWRIE